MARKKNKSPKSAGGTPAKQKGAARKSRVLVHEHRDVELTGRVPVLFLVSQVVFPFGATQVRIRTERNLALLDALIDDDDAFAVAFAPGADPDAVVRADLGNIGIAARVIARLRLPDGTEQVTLQGLERVYFENVEDTGPYFTANAAIVVTAPVDATAAESIILQILDTVREMAAMDVGVQAEHVSILETNVGDPGAFADLVSAMAGLELPNQKVVLEKLDVLERLGYVAGLVNEQLEYARVQQETDATARQEIAEAQREYYLRRQMKVLRDQLGETSREEQAANDALAKLQKLDLPEAADRAVRTEIDRMRATNSASAEFGVIQNYLDWMLSLPWNTSCDDRLDVAEVRGTLDGDHFGLDIPKQRILEYLAVRALKPEAPAPILCFVGPPGTGKTSLAQSIARATGRELVRIAVGGVRDESAIRGHRRTYVGAMPGRFIKGLRKAQCNNPVMVIDEVDKLGEGPQGDPSAALLEVLDPEQNTTFTDSYLDVPFDLSKSFFIATANEWFAIPGPLRDRMEMIELSSYVADEKVEIARRHLIPKVAERTGLPHAVSIDKTALRLLIRSYTMEAGVRGLQRRIASLFRKLALEVTAGRTIPKRIGKKHVVELLGPPPIPPEARRRRDEVGVVNGLAWTSVGGDVLLVEALRVPGAGNLQITGQLGDVMRESVAAAHTYVRSRAVELGIGVEAFTQGDLHLHFPEGATPKDGPSAGIAVAVALASIYTDRKVRADVAMTGEITLRGHVLPIGGLKEKLSAAARLGIKHVIIPKANEGSLHWVRDEVLSRITVHAVSHVDEVLALALRARPSRKTN